MWPSKDTDLAVTTLNMILTSSTSPPTTLTARYWSKRYPRRWGSPTPSEVEIHPLNNNKSMGKPNRPQMFTGIFWDGTLSRPMSLPVSCYKNSAKEPRKEKPRMGKWVPFLVLFLSVQIALLVHLSRGEPGRYRFGYLFADGSFHSRQPVLLSGTKNALSCGRGSPVVIITWTFARPHPIFKAVNILGNNFLSDYPAGMRYLSDGRYCFYFL